MASWQDVQQGANPFISATRILETVAEGGKQQLGNDQGNQFWMHTMIPVIVMKSFSCELMLKAILLHENIEFGKTHKLNDLFKLLDSSAHSTPQARAMQAAIRAAVIAEMGGESCGYNDSQFNANLDEAANLFVDWRYFFESSTSGQQLTAPITFLHKFFLELEIQKNALL